MTWQSAISQAERVATGRVGEPSQLDDAVYELMGTADLLRGPGVGRDVAYLTGLLDSIGRADLSHRLVRVVVSRALREPPDPGADGGGRGRIGFALANRGDPVAAVMLAFEEHFPLPGASELDKARTAAGLAVLKLRAGDVEASAECARRARAMLRPVTEAADRLDVELLVVPVLVEAARLGNRREEADSLLDELEALARQAVALFGEEHPKSSSALLALASAEFGAASADGDRDRMERAVDVLALTAQKVSATFGAGHPVALSALRAFAGAEYEAAAQLGPEQRVADARALVASTLARTEPRRESAPQAMGLGPRTTSAPPPVQRQPRKGGARRAAERPEGRGGGELASAVDSASLRFAVLGPLRAWQGEESLPTGTPQQRAFLTALLLRGGRAATAQELIDGIWGEDPPPRASVALRTYASRLRRVLGKVLVIESGGYALRMRGTELDLATAERLASAAEAARFEGDVRRARELYAAAVAEFGGEPLAGVPGPYAEWHRDRLAELRLALLEHRLELDLETGGHVDAVSELTTLTAAHPLRERFRALLMTALYRSGRQAEALAVYADVRRRLQDELGLDPHAELTELQHRILQADADLAVPEAEPSHSRSARPNQLPFTVGDHVARRGGSRNVGIDKRVVPVQELPRAVQEVLHQLLTLIAELRAHVPPAEAEVLDDSLPALRAEADVQPQERHRALLAVAGIAATVGAIGVPVVEATNEVLERMGVR